MNKYIYGMIGSSHLLKRRNIRGSENSLYVVDNNSMIFASEIAFTLHHDPKLLIGTTRQSSIQLFRNAEGIFFRYLIKTEEENRLHRMVKQGKYKQCSYTRYLGEFRRKLNWEGKWPSPNQKIFIEKKALLFEICLTNTPFDTYTFCTVHEDDWRLSNVDWTQPLDLGAEDAWKRRMEIDKKLKLIQEYKELVNEQLEIEKELALRESYAN